MKHTFFSLADGRYLGAVDTPYPESLDRNMPEGARAVLGGYSYDSYFVDGEVRAIPPRPDAYSTWDFAAHEWRDIRTDDERAADAAEEIDAARRAAYPPLADLADALYWQSQGDNSKMDAYNAAIAAVKEQFPKSN